MINLTKMNLNRLFFNKLFYVLLLINIGLCMFVASISVDTEDQELDRQIMEAQGIGSEDDSVGLTIGGDLTEDTPFEDIYAEVVGSGVMLIFVGVFASVYIDEERKSGFLKNLTVGKTGKKYIFASKLPVMLIFSVLLILTGLAAMYLSCNRSGTYAITEWGDLINYVLTQSLLHTAFGIAVMVCYELFRSVVINILVAVFAAFNLFGFIIALLERYIGFIRMLTEVWGGRLELTQYMLITRVTNLQITGNAFPFVPSLAVALAGLVWYIMLGMVIHGRRDTV